MPRRHGPESSTGAGWDFGLAPGVGDAGPDSREADFDEISEWLRPGAAEKSASKAWGRSSNEIHRQPSIFQPDGIIANDSFSILGYSGAIHPHRATVGIAKHSVPMSYLRGSRAIRPLCAHHHHRRAGDKFPPSNDRPTAPFCQVVPFSFSSKMKTFGASLTPPSFMAVFNSLDFRNFAALAAVSHWKSRQRLFGFPGTCPTM